MTTAATQSVPLVPLVPLVSVVIATYTGPGYTDARYLKDAVDSVRAQTHPCEVEIVIVDCGSLVPTPPVFGDVHVYTSANIGVCQAFALGVRAARADWLLCLNADDTLAPHFLAAAFEALAETPYYSYGALVSKEPLGPAILLDNYIPYCALLHRELWDTMGGFQDVLDEGGACRLADWDLWIRIFQHYAKRGQWPLLAYIHDPSVWVHRDRPDSASKWDSAEFERLRAKLWQIHGVSKL